MKILASVKPRAKREFVRREGENAFTVSVSAPPAGGKANAAARDALARHFGVAHSRVRLVRGASSKNKIFEIDQ